MNFHGFIRPYIQSLHSPDKGKDFAPLIITLLLLFIPFFTVLIILKGIQDTRNSTHADSIALAGNVYIDANNNGIKEPDEIGYQGAMVTLSGPTSKTTVSDLNGNYSFTDLDPGGYSLQIKPPDGYNSTSTVNVGVGDPATQYDFGVEQEAGTHNISAFDFTASDGTLLEAYNAAWSRVDTADAASGRAIITGNHLAPASGDSYWYKLNQTDYNSCIAADVQWPLAGYAELSLRQQNPTNRAYLYINQPNDFGIVVQRGDNTETKIGGAFPQPDGWHSVKFCDAGEGIMRLYIDNVLKLDSPVGDESLTNGNPSIRSFGAVLDNVSFIHQTVPPQIPHVELRDGSSTTIQQNFVYSTSGGFSDLDSTSWTATVDYGDGSGPQPLILTDAKTFALNHRYTQSGIFTVTVGVTDNQGITGTGVAQVTVDDAPVVSPMDETTINSGDTYEEQGSFTDPDSTSWTATVDYGDGSGVQPLALHDKSFTLQHVFIQKQSYNIIVVVKDDRNISGSTVVVLNVNKEPQIQPQTDTLINEGTLYQAPVSFTDPDSKSWTADIDYGEGTPHQTLNLPAGATGFNYNHLYASYGTYMVKARITDNLGLFSDTLTTVTVNAVPKIDPVTGASINEGDTYHSSASFTDPDSASWTAAVDYGDGTGIQTIPLTTKNFTLNHIYQTYGQYTVLVKVTDDKGAIGTNTTTVKVNAIPRVNSITNTTANEGQTYTASGSFIDPDSTSWTATVDYGDGLGAQALPLTGKNFTLTHTYKDNGVAAVKVTVKDDFPASGSTSAVVTVNNVAPSVAPVTLSAALVKINTSITATTSFTDPGMLDTHTATVNWGDGTTANGAVSGTNTSGSVKGTHTYTKAGYYTIAVSVKDKDGGVGQATALLPVYAPSTSSGFQAVSTSAPLIGINMKYTNSAAPTGTVQMAGQNMIFNATAYQFLVIGNGKAYVKGTGTFNGKANYKFLAAGMTTTGGKIRFQIKDPSGNPVYDSQPGAADNADPTTPVKGAVVIH